MPPASPRLSVRARALWAWAIGAVGCGVLISIVVSVPGGPYNAGKLVEAMVGKGVIFPVISMSLLVAAAIGIGVVSAWAGRWAFAQDRRVRWLPVLLIGGALTLGLVITIVASEQSVNDLVGFPQWGIGWYLEAIVRLAGLLLLPIAALSMGAIWWDRLEGWGVRMAVRNLLHMVPPIIFCLALSRLIVLHLAATTNLTELIDKAGALPEFYLLLGLFLIAFNAGAAGRGAASQGLDRWAMLLATALLTLLAAFIAYVLFRMGTATGIQKYESGFTFSAANFLLSASRQTNLSDLQLLLRWYVVYFGMVAVFGLGVGIGLRLGPLPRVRKDDDEDEGPDAGVMPLPRSIEGINEAAVVVPEEEITPPPAPRAYVEKPRVRPVEPEPPAENEFPTRLHYLILCLLGCVTVFYASIVPLDYKPVRGAPPVLAAQLSIGIKEFDDQLAKSDILPANVYRRADWLANLAVFVPLGFLGLGAIDAGRRSFWPLILLGPLVLLGLLVLVVAIEFTQVWFPIRTVSYHDMLAETIGTGLGALLWLALGRRVTRWARVLARDAATEAGRRRLTQVYAAVLLLYSLFPLDITFSASELKTKFQEGRIILSPFAMGNRGLAEILLHFVKDIVMFIPIGVLVQRGWWWWGRHTLKRSSAIGITLALAAALELLHLVIFQSTFEVRQGIALGIGAVLGVWLGEKLLDEEGTVRIGQSLSRGSRRLVAGALLMLFAMSVLGLMWSPWRFVDNREQFFERLRYILAPPLKHYYYSGEWTALFKVTYCVLLFTPVGVLCRWAAVSARRARPLQQGLWMGRGLPTALLFALIFGGIIEVGQAAVVKSATYRTPEEIVQTPQFFDGQIIDVTPPTLSKGAQYLEGRFPDMTDLMAYLCGAWLGWFAARVFLAERGISQTQTAFAPTLPPTNKRASHSGRPGCGRHEAYPASDQ